LRINGKKNHNPFDSTINTSNDHNTITPIDILVVDKYSRLTLTKKVKKIIPLSPEDKIIFYLDPYTKNILLKVQQGEKVVDDWVLTRTKNNTKLYTDTDTHSNNGISLNDNKTGSGTKNNAGEGGGVGGGENNTLYSIPILLVDDEQDLLMTFDFLLRDEGYSNVKAFSESRDMLKHLLDTKNSALYKLAIIDIRMPDINGIQLYQILKTLNPTIKILFITAMDAADELTSIYTEVKNTDILRKPIEQNQFIKAVNDKVSAL
jgi:CheY-like chemotaxis protein